MPVTLWSELGGSFRRLRRLRGAAILAMVTIALALGACLSMFSVYYAAVLRTVSAPAPGRLVSITSTDTRNGQPAAVYRTSFAALREALAGHATVAMYSPMLVRVQRGALWLDAGAEGVTTDYFSIVGARLAQGRFFTESDLDTGAGPAPVGVVSERMWRRLTDAGARALGELISVEGMSVAVVGVVADGSGTLDSDVASDIYLPVTFVRSLAGDQPATVRAPYVVGRLAEDVSIAQLGAAVDARWPSIRAATASALPVPIQQAMAFQSPRVESLARGFSGIRRQYGQSLSVLSALAALLLVVAAVNVAGVMAISALARRHEVAMRLTLGASMASILRQQLLDGVVLALSALAFALPAACWTSQVVTAIVSVARPLPLAQSLAPGGIVFAVAVVSAIAIGLFVGLVPGWLALRTRPEDAVRSTRTSTPNHDRATTLFLVAQVAVSLVLVVGATMLSGTLQELRANRAGLPVGNVLWTRLARNPADKSGGVDRTYLQQLTERLSAVPGVDSAVLSAYFPAFLGYVGKLPQDDYSRMGMNGDGQPVSALTELVSPGFFRAFGIASTAGRDFTWDDDDSAPAVVVLNEAMASRLFPERNGVGQSIRIGGGASATDMTVVGVVADSTIGSLREPHLPVAFRPMAQSLARARFPLVHARVKGGVASVREGYVKAVEAPGRHFVRGLFTLEEWTEFALLRERMAAGLAAWAASLAVLLCGIGVYGLLAYSVTARTREIGVRVAMGATSADVAAMVIRKGMVIVLLGIAVGVPCALAAAQVVGAQVTASIGNYWPALAGGAVLFFVIGTAASALPGLRAAGIAPWEALRDQ